MIGKIIAAARIALGFVLLSLNTLLHCVPLLTLAVFKPLIPIARRGPVNALLSAIAESWIGVNSALIVTLTSTRTTVTGDIDLQRDGHYLVLANHQSWVDIPVLQQVFNRRIPLLRFFLKDQLFWVPVLGLAWWALDFPFMKRYSREQIQRRPELAGRDIEVTRLACEKFRYIPISVMNFVEGTRFTAGKHARQQSPYRHLLKPRAGGVAFVLGAMGQGLHSIVDVTLVYPAGRPSIADLFANRIPEVHVDVRRREIPAAFVGRDYAEDAGFKREFQTWINELWSAKDQRITAMLAEGTDRHAVGPSGSAP